MKLRKIISQLHRRNVFKSTIAYLAVAWVIIQIASIALPAFNAPDYSIKIVIYLLAAGLLFWIGFSWIYDLTPQGFQKTDDILDDKETLLLTNRRLNKVIVGALSIAVLLLVSVSFWAGSKWNEGFADSNKRVAVVPFAYDGENGDGEEASYFQSGMTNGLIDELSKVDQLTMISQASTRLMVSDLSTANLLILNEVKRIDYFIYGTIQRQLNTLTIELELRESWKSDAVWKKEYARDIVNTRTLWADAAADISRQMDIEVKQEDAELWSNLRPIRPKTFELYLKGKHHLNKSTEADWQRGLVYLQQAIDDNPADPYAWAGMAEGYIMLGHGPAPPPDVFPKALAAAERAIQLDSTIAEGWAALAHYHTYFGWDWQLAERAFKRADELNPNMAYNHYHRAWYLALFGKMNEAIEEHKRAQELDPFTPLHTAWLGELFRLVGQYDEGLAEADKAALMQDNYALGKMIKGRIYMDQGQYETGLELIKQASAINPGWKYYGYGSALFKAGQRAEGQVIIDELEGMPPTPFGALCLGIIYAESGDFDKALEWFSYENKHGWYPWIRVMSPQKELLEDPRFLDLIREMNLPYPAPLEYDPDA